MTDPRLIEFARRIKLQCVRFDIFHNIDLTSSPEELRAAVDHAIHELEAMTGIARQSADFIGAIEYYGSGRFHYFRG